MSDEALETVIHKLYNAARHPSPKGAYLPMKELLAAYGAERERQGMEKALVQPLDCEPEHEEERGSAAHLRTAIYRRISGETK